MRIRYWREEPDPWTRPAVPVERLAAEREAAVKFMVDECGYKPPIVFTCDGCSFAPRCTLAFDPYNTNGDCLYDK